MNLQTLKEQISKKQLDSFYVFTGEETSILNIYIDKMAQIKKAKIIRAESMANIFSKLQNKSFVNVPNCYVIRDDKEYQTQEKIWPRLFSGSEQGDHLIIFVYSSIDKRSKFYKAHVNYIVEFEKLSTDILAKYAKKEIGLDEARGKQLVELCDRDYGRLMLECNKLFVLANVMQLPIDQAFRIALQDKLIYLPPGDVIFDLIDAVLRHEHGRAFLLWQQLLMLSENPLAVISLLYNNFRSVLLVQSAGSRENLTQKTGLTPWQIKLASDKVGNYSVSELINTIRLLRETEKGIKTGAIEQDMAVDYLLVNIF